MDIIGNWYYIENVLYGLSEQTTEIKDINQILDILNNVNVLNLSLDTIFVSILSICFLTLPAGLFLFCLMVPLTLPPIKCIFEGLELHLINYNSIFDRRNFLSVDGTFISGILQQMLSLLLYPSNKMNNINIIKSCDNCDIC